MVTKAIMSRYKKNGMGQIPNKDWMAFGATAFPVISDKVLTLQ